MIKMRRIYANWSESDQNYLKSIGIVLESGTGFGSFDIEEGDIYRDLATSFLSQKREDFSDTQIGTFFSDNEIENSDHYSVTCLLYTSPSPRDRQKSRMPSSA